MKKAIVIGATSGIGRQLALLLAGHGYVVGATGRRKEKLEELKAERPAHILISDFDVSRPFELTKKLEELCRQLGGLDLLIISSGLGDFNEKLDFAIEKRAIEVNVLGFTEAADWAFNFFQNQQSGHLVGISSIGGLRGSRKAPAYNATKAYQINYLEGLRQKAKKLDLPIFVTDIRPGFVDTEMAKGEGKFWVSPVEKAAKQIFAAIERRKSVAYITRRWRAIAGLLRFLPRQIYQKM